jgi:hypothetical protein
VDQRIEREPREPHCEPDGERDDQQCTTSGDAAERHDAAP